MNELMINRQNDVKNKIPTPKKNKKPELDNQDFPMKIEELSEFVSRENKTKNININITKNIDPKNTSKKIKPHKNKQFFNIFYQEIPENVSKMELSDLSDFSDSNSDDSIDKLNNNFSKNKISENNILQNLNSDEYSWHCLRYNSEINLAESEELFNKFLTFQI